MSRKDKLTRQLSYPERRKRRNLSDFPRVALGTAVPEDGDVTGCPNAGPYDALAERCTLQDTAEVAGDPYEVITLAEKNIIGGTDVVSYCFEGRVGPGTGPVYVTCEGKAGLLVDGLIHYEDWSDPATPGWNHGPGGVTRERDVTLDLWYIKATSPGQYESMEQTDEGCVKIFQTASVPAALTRGPFVGAQVGKYCGGGTKGFAGANYMMIGETDPVVDNGNINNFWFNPTLLVESGSQELHGQRVSQTNSPLTDTDVTHQGVDDYMGYFVDYGCTTTGCPWQEYLRDGYAKVYPMWLMKGNTILFKGLPTGWYIRLHWNGAVWKTQAESSGEIEFDLEWAHPDQLDCFEVWDGDPTAGGVLQFTCCPPRGLFGGDVWQICPDGDCATSDFVGDAQATVKMEFLDALDAVIATFEPSGAVSEGFTRTANTEVIDIEVPWDAKKVRWTPWKRGTADAYACIQKLQFNVGTVCCEYTAVPGTSEAEDALFGSVSATDLEQSVDTDQDGVYDAHVTRVYDTERSDGTAAGAVIWEGDQIGDAYEEHREGAQNIMGFDSSAEKDGPGVGTAGEPEVGCGDDYDPVDLEAWGIEPGVDTLSLRFKGKVG